MNKEKILQLLPAIELSNQDEKARREQFASYIIRLLLAKDRAGKIVNTFIQNKTEQEMVNLYLRVAKDGLSFDGKHVTLQSTGVTYDYVSYKNKMFIAYPESKIDMELVFKGDTFNFAKESGSVIYHHTIADPFNHKADDVMGAYCVIINKRGEFMTTLSKEELEKHRAIAKTKNVWNDWFVEMCLKTVIKKACKKHFDDIYENIESLDNDNYNLDNPLDLEAKYKDEIDNITGIKELMEYYLNNQGRGASFDKYISMKKDELSKQLKQSGDVVTDDKGDIVYINKPQ